MGDGLKCLVVAPGSFPFEQTFPVYVLSASWRMPILLVSVLVSHEPEEVPAHVIVIEIRLVPVSPVVNELIGQCVDQKSSPLEHPTCPSRLASFCTDGSGFHYRGCSYP